eukprot:COSAG02_NODE_187_length_30377_cov_3.636271_3_plen_416_part_00
MGDKKQYWLCFNAYYGSKEGVLRELREGATPNGEGNGDYAGLTPLGCAAGSTKKQGEKHWRGHVDDPLGCLGALLDAGAQPDRPQSRGGMTPLCLGANDGHADRVRLLLERGATPSLANAQSGESPLSLARAGGHQQVVAALLMALGDLLPTLESEEDPATQAALCAAQVGHDATVAALVRDAALDSGGLRLLALDLSGQRLTHLPAGVLSLKELQWLSLRDNDLDELPLGLTELRRLAVLLLGGNPQLLREEAIAHEEGVSAVFDYLRDLHDDPQPTFKLKLLLAGPSMAGKSSVKNRLMDLPEADVLADADTERTIGLDIVPEVVLADPQGRAPHPGITLSVYDAGGHDGYREMLQVFVTEDMVSLLLWNLARRPSEGQDEETFERESVAQQVQWAQIIQSCAPGSTVRPRCS